jgi:hypothetical protein
MARSLIRSSTVTGREAAAGAAPDEMAAHRPAREWWGVGVHVEVLTINRADAILIVQVEAVAYVST